MANCPNCGSDHIQIRRETNVSWGRAVAGWALFGAVGGAVGAVTGEDRNVNACLDCGTAWKAADLYRTLQGIKDLTGFSLNLARENDRLYMNHFMSEVGPCLAAISEAEKKATKHLESAQSKVNSGVAGGCGFGCLTSLFLAFSFLLFGSFGLLASSSPLWLLVFFPPVIGYWLGYSSDQTMKKAIEREINRAKMQADQMKFEAEENLRRKLTELESYYSVLLQQNPDRSLG
jgi:hypothetical protein